MKITFQSIIGKHILVGITYLDKEGNITKQVQFDGTVIAANQNESIIIKKTESNEDFELPPDLSFLRVAAPGEYRLKSIEKTVINPDLLSTLIISK